MVSVTKRTTEQVAYVLHTYPYRETSLIVEILTPDHGRVALVARGAKRPRSELRGLLQGFQPLTLTWYGQGELKTLVKAEWRGGLALVGGSASLCGFYLNELLLKLLPREDPHAKLFDDYQNALRQLVSGASQAGVLRQFELRLLAEMGYGVQLTTEAETSKPIEPDARYYYVFERGPRRVLSGVQAEHRSQFPHVLGSTLLALEKQDYGASESATEAKFLMRQILNYYLEQKGVFSRQVVQDLRALEEREELARRD